MSVQQQLHRRDPHHYDASLGEGDDWTAALQWANDDLARIHGGGEVILPPYEIRISGYIDYDSRITWTGHGFNSIVRVADGAQGGFRSRGFGGLLGTDSTLGVYETGFQDFTIHGNSADGGTGSGILHYGTSQWVDNVFIRECSEFGIRTEWASGNAYGVLGAAAGPPPAVIVGRGLENRYTRLSLQDNGIANMWHNGPHDSFIHDVVAVQQYLPAKTVDNILIDAKAGGTQLSKIHTWGGDTDYGVNINVGACRLVDIVAEGANIAQMRIASTGGIYVMGAHLFGQNNGIQKGLLLDGVGSGIMLGLKFNRCEGGAIDFTGDLGNNDIQAVITPPATGPLVVGTPNARTRYSWVSDISAVAGQGEVVVNSLNQDLGFYGTTPVPQPPTPVTLADVIALLQANGLSQ